MNSRNFQLATAALISLFLASCAELKKIDPMPLSPLSAKPESAPNTSPLSESQINEAISLVAQPSLDTKKVYTKIGFGSCLHQKQAHPILTPILSEKFDLFLGLGDNVYASHSNDKPIPAMYALLAKSADYLKLRKEVPTLATWDDHDYGQGDGGKDNPDKSIALEIFKKFFKVSSDLIDKNQEGIYHSVTLGPRNKDVQMILLDTRSFRDSLEKHTAPKHPLDIYQPTQDKSKTLLGEKQWLWLESELKKPSRLKVIVSSIQFLPEEHGFEKWANFPHERDRLTQLLKKTKAKTILVLSGDRHMAEFSKLSVGKQTQIIELTSSGLNRPSNLLNEPNKHRIGKYYGQVNYGSLEIDWAKYQAKISIKDVNGILLESQSVIF